MVLADGCCEFIEYRLGSAAAQGRELERRPRGPRGGKVGSTEEAFDEEQVRLLLIGTEEEIGQALSLIDNHLRRRICAWLRKQQAWMSSEDLADAWQETLMGVFKAVRAERFDPNLPLIPWLLSIASARGIDKRRRKISSERALAAVGEALRGTRLGRVWEVRLAEERNEILACVRTKILGMPEKQRRVMQVFDEGYPDTKDMQVLRVEVSKVSGQEETLASVKRALQEARLKLRECLKAKGYEIGK
jgi:DNA-directed RNA polymerase specialized sigma24 family protein